MSEKILTKKDIVKARQRWFLTLELPNSFERLQAVSFTYTISDALQKLYKDDEEGLKDALKRHLEFFNTEGTIGSLIVGIVLALEEKKKIDGDVVIEREFLNCAIGSRCIPGDAGFSRNFFWKATTLSCVFFGSLKTASKNVSDKNSLIVILLFY